MSRLTCGIMVCSLAVTVGCNKGTSTAPATSRSPNQSAESTNRKLTVSVRGSQTITQDKTDEITVMIDRDNFSAPVTVELRNLPDGVSVVTKDLTIPADKTSLTVTLKATPDAAPVTDHASQASAKAKDQKDLAEAVANFKLTVKAK